MMNEKELMIGNWVLYNGKPHKVWGLKEGIFIEEYDLNYWKEVTPIPLTPEILEAAGFEKNGFIKDNISVRKGMLVIGGSDAQMAWEVECKYLHQLQNLYFALTGTELKVSLTEKVNV